MCPHSIDSPSPQVGAKAGARHFHAAQLPTRLLKEGFATRGMDWSAVRRRGGGREGSRGYYRRGRRGWERLLLRRRGTEGGGVGAGVHG